MSSSSSSTTNSPPPKLAALKFLPKTPAPVIHRSIWCVYDDPGVETLERITEIRLIEFEWAWDATIRNLTSSEQSTVFSTVTLTTEQAIKGQGKALKEPWTAPKILRELGKLEAVIDGERHLIIDGRKGAPAVDRPLVMRPNGLVHVYRKRYVVLISLTFRVNIEGRVSVIMTNHVNDEGEAVRLCAVDRVVVRTAEFFASPDLLDPYWADTVDITAEPDESGNCGWIRLKHCSNRCQGALASHGVLGPSYSLPW